MCHLPRAGPQGLSRARDARRPAAVSSLKSQVEGEGVELQIPAPSWVPGLPLLSHVRVGLHDAVMMLGWVIRQVPSDPSPKSNA